MANKPINLLSRLTSITIVDKSAKIEGQQVDWQSLRLEGEIKESPFVVELSIKSKDSNFLQFADVINPELETQE